ncbi:DNA adenine methylase [Parascardovia denticolens IPLA 20019]|uniref:DNA adenine methylase n=1 Tax=Parascardovia denticolens TaxID=78258 RepID=UPI0002669DD5|nr:DNA adenine methylase [Parascardovia denticolens]EIT89086.1 DNA adenine methylase [Parascardovia denticolens IPLA 20019]
MMSETRLTNGSSTPLRYPGGKGKVTRFVDHILTQNQISGTYVEPFAGGAGIAINLLLHDKVDRIILNDLDDGVYSFWSTIVHSPDTLIKKIQEVPFDYSSGLDTIGPRKAYWFWYNTRLRYRSNHYAKKEDKAFDFLMLNRMNVSGIILGGPIGGESQNGEYNISSRFNKTTLIRKIERLSSVRNRIIATQYEASFFLSRLSNYCDNNNCLVFADPPYFVQGKNLYKTFATDSIHQMMAARLLTDHPWKWILTYDEAPEINRLYSAGKINRFEYEITYSANKRGNYKEFMFADPRLTMESFDNVNLQPID